MTRGASRAMRPPAADYRPWFDYERDSHPKGPAPLNAGAPEFRKAAALLGHIIEARRLWLFRMGAAQEGPKLADMFAEGASLPELSNRLEEMHAAWSRHLATLDDAAIARHFEYRSFEGQP